MFIKIEGIGKQSRSIFMQMDANAAKSPPIGTSAPTTPSPRTPDVRRNVQVFVKACDA